MFKLMIAAIVLSMTAAFTVYAQSITVWGSNDGDNAFDSSNVEAHADGSILERLEYIQQQIPIQYPN